MLETNNLTKRFGGHVAVNAVSCSFAPGTLTAIVGPNGAGKTTYFNLISGQIPAGTIRRNPDLPQRSCLLGKVNRLPRKNNVDIGPARGLYVEQADRQRKAGTVEEARKC